MNKVSFILNELSNLESSDIPCIYSHLLLNLLALVSPSDFVFSHITCQARSILTTAIMGSLGPITDSLSDVPSTFDVMDDPRPNDTTLPPFMVSTRRGFLPRAHPVVDLPSDFGALNTILENMPLVKADGTSGLLMHGKLGDTVLSDLPDLSEAVEKYADNLPLQNALYRDYSFLASAYLLEPCHLRFMKGEEYGLGRDHLPKQISMPLSICAKISGFKPFMEYAGSYALYNYRLEDSKGGMEYDNLRLIRAFEKGLDPKSSEAGFVLIHVEMVKNSGPLVEGAMKALEGVKNQDRDGFEEGMGQVVGAMKNVNTVMEREYHDSITTQSAISADKEQACGRNQSQTNTPPSAPSSWASPLNPCFPTASSTKASPRNRSASAARAEQTTA